MNLPTEALPRHNLLICVTCRRNDWSPDEMRDGMKLFHAIQRALGSDSDRVGYRVSAIECMSGCNRACTVGLAAQGKPSYLFGDLAPTCETAEDALRLVALYRDRADGVVARGERPSCFRRGILARIPAAPP